MSKAYALSGLRVAYLCASPQQLEPLRAITPPWVVGLPAQIAAVKALDDPQYYAAKHRQTHTLRKQLAIALAGLNWKTIPSCANFLLCHLPTNGPDAATLIAQCRQRGLFVRNACAMGSELGDRAIRLAVKDAATNRRMIEILSKFSDSQISRAYAPQEMRSIGKPVIKEMENIQKLRLGKPSRFICRE